MKKREKEEKKRRRIEEEEKKREKMYGNYDFGMDYWTFGLLYGFLWVDI